MSLTGRIMAGALLLAIPLAVAQGGDYDIVRQSIDGGAQTAEGAGYRLAGTLGQPDAAPVASGGDYALRGGFHRPAAESVPSEDLLFADGFEP